MFGGYRRDKIEILGFVPCHATTRAVFWKKEKKKIKAFFVPVVGWSTIRFVERSSASWHRGGKLDGSDEENTQTEIVACIISDEHSTLSAADDADNFLAIDLSPDDETDWDAYAREEYELFGNEALRGEVPTFRCMAPDPCLVCKELAEIDLRVSVRKAKANKVRTLRPVNGS